MLFARIGEHGPVVTFFAFLLIGVVCSLWHFLLGALKLSRLVKQLQIRAGEAVGCFTEEELRINEIDVKEWEAWFFATTATFVHVGLIVSFKHEKRVLTQQAIARYIRKLRKLIESNSPARKYQVDTIQFIVKSCKNTSMKQYSEQMVSLVHGFFPNASCEILKKGLCKAIEVSIAVVNHSGFVCTGDEPCAMNPDVGY